MKRIPELLAPGGDIDAIKAAIFAGADAIYCGLDRFNARNAAANISFDDLPGILRLAHQNNCRVFLTLNIIFLESEIPALIGLLNKLQNTKIDGIIVQDFGMFYQLTTYFKGFCIHASTQLTTHNEGQIAFLSKLKAERVNLSRELNIQEIKALTAVAHQNNILTEVFVHGSNCISFSGICYMSSVQGGNSGNRGRCSQPCRDSYHTTAAAKDYPLNLKDNSAFDDLQELYDAGVDALKIEGRIKQYDYVYTVVNAWKKQLLGFYRDDKISNDKQDLYKVFNRDFSDAFLKGEIHKDMFIDHPRDYSIQYLKQNNPDATEDEMEALLQAWYAGKDQLKSRLEKEIKAFDLAKLPLSIEVSGECGKPLKLRVKTPDTSFEVISEIKLSDRGMQVLDYDMLMKRLKAINDTEFYIEQLNLDQLDQQVFLPFNALTAIKKTILLQLNDSTETAIPIQLPVIEKRSPLKTNAELAVFISSPEDVYLCNETDATIYYQLSDSFKHDLDALITLFKNNEKLIPCFPSVLIGEDYKAAVALLHDVKPRLIVSNNTGIAYEAFRSGISWIAGPFLNIANTYSLLCLKEKFNCSGAFLSNELNKTQLQQIKSPADFELFYSIFHPIVLMTSRQCLFHQVTGCEKDSMDEDCLPYCEKSAWITNFKNQDLLIEKSRGNHHRIYHETAFLNTDIVNDLPGFFVGYSIDLSNIKTTTQLKADKKSLIQLFQRLLNGDAASAAEIRQNIHPATHAQYIKGIG